MIKKSLWRSTKDEKAYTKHRNQLQQSDRSCDFCEFTQGMAPVIEDLGVVWIINNIFPYDNWDGFRVVDHLLIVPKRHIESIADFSDQELSEFAEAIKRYESNGYAVYARPPINAAKSVPHQHTHLLKLSDKQLKHLSYDILLNHRLVR